MTSKSNLHLSDELAQRKSAHIELASRAQTPVGSLDSRFDYEPMFFSHPTDGDIWPITFLERPMNFPIWVSSMTGGTAHAQEINKNLARLCGEYKLGMGLGSCRALLQDDSRLQEFQVRKYLNEQPLYANLGLAQIEQLVNNNQIHKIEEMVRKLDADGLMIHLNPLQEWFQPEGDRYQVSPLITLTRLLEKSQLPMMVKEVGQGMGPKSLKALLDLPLKGIEFGAFGGTNFSMLESMRGNELGNKRPFIQVGHTALEMVEILNAFPDRKKDFIISGGISNVLDGYELKMRFKSNAVIGMAQAFLKPAMESYETLQLHFVELKDSLLTAKGLLKVKGDI